MGEKSFQFHFSYPCVMLSNCIEPTTNNMNQLFSLKHVTHLFSPALISVFPVRNTSYCHFTSTQHWYQKKKYFTRWGELSCDPHPLCWAYKDLTVLLSHPQVDTQQSARHPVLPSSFSPIFGSLPSSPLFFS